MIEMIIGIPMGLGILWVFGTVLNWLLDIDGRCYRPDEYFDGGFGSQGPLSG